MVTDPRMRKYVGNLKRFERGLNSNRRKIKRRENKMIRQAQRAIKEGNQPEARIITKDIARSRKMSLDLTKIRTRIVSVRMQLEQADAMRSMGKEMASAVRTLRVINRSLNVGDMGAIVDALDEELIEIMEGRDVLLEDFSLTEDPFTEDEEAENILSELRAKTIDLPDVAIPDVPVDAGEKKIRQKDKNLK